MSFPIVYVAGEFPKQSETFVYREVRALRAAGWPVTTASLNEPTKKGLGDLADLQSGTIYVYGRGRTATIAAVFAEAFSHPIQTARTKLLALRDAISPGEKTSAGARVKLIAQAFAGIGLARRLRRAGVRHVHCHFAHAPATVGMYAARQLGVPFSFTGHANDIFQRRALLRRKLERSAFVACISEWHRDFYREIAPERADRYHVVRCGVDVNAWTPKPDAGREISAQDTLRVLTVCRLVEKKGVDTLIRGLAEFGKTTGRRFRLTVAGDGPERARLEKIAEEIGSFDSITWLGAVDNDRVRVRLAECDLFVLPCKEDHSGDRDGIPVVLMEAMACGAPVVSGDLPAIRELVSDGVTGVLVDGNRPEQLSSALVRLVDAPALRAKLARAGRERVEQEFSLTGNVGRLTHLFTVNHSEKKAYES